MPLTVQTGLQMIMMLLNYSVVKCKFVSAFNKLYFTSDPQTLLKRIHNRYYHVLTPVVMYKLQNSKNLDRVECQTLVQGMNQQNVMCLVSKPNLGEIISSLLRQLSGKLTIKVGICRQFHQGLISYSNYEMIIFIKCLL